MLRRLQASPQDLIARAKLGGMVGFAVADASDGRILERSGARRGLPPASVAKAMTAAYALEKLGPDHRFSTRILATGGIRDGVVTGDLVLAGGGDPTLDTDRLAQLASQMKARGIREVRGRFLVWGGALPYANRIDALQPDHVGYNPAVSGLNLNFNRVHFQWARSGGTYSVTMDARSAAHRPEVQIARMQVADRKTPVYVYADRNGQDRWSVASAALGDGGSRWLPVRKPELYAGEVFQTFARAHGIVLDAPQITRNVPKGEVLARDQSAPLSRILRDMLKWSTNLTAEAVGLSATTAMQGAPPASIAASAAAMNAWAMARFDLSDVALVDHSGLGDQSRISAEAMLKSLHALRRDGMLKPLLKPFTMRDAQRRPMKDHPVTVLAKTGTLNFVSGLAGYAELPDGRELVFAIFAADLDRRAGLGMNDRERPAGGRSWNVRAKTLQQRLIERWAVVHAADASREF